MSAKKPPGKLKPLFMGGTLSNAALVRHYPKGDLSLSDAIKFDHTQELRRARIAKAECPKLKKTPAGPRRARKHNPQVNGEMVRELRRPHGQEKFAELTGLSVDTIQRAEKGIPISAKKLGKIARYASTKAGKKILPSHFTITPSTPQ